MSTKWYYYRISGWHQQTVCIGYHHQMNSHWTKLIFTELGGNIGQPTVVARCWNHTRKKKIHSAWNNNEGNDDDGVAISHLPRGRFKVIAAHGVRWWWGRVASIDGESQRLTLFVCAWICLHPEMTNDGWTGGDLLPLQIGRGAETFNYRVNFSLITCTMTVNQCEQSL